MARKYGGASCQRPGGLVRLTQAAGESPGWAHPDGLCASRVRKSGRTSRCSIGTKRTGTPQRGMSKGVP